MGETAANSGGRKRWRRIVVAAAGLLVALVLTGLFLCWFFGIRSRADLQAYRYMMTENFHAVWKDLALRRVQKGNSLSETIRKYPPVRREECGPFTALLYQERGAFNWLQIIATDGVLISARAGSCCWRHVFFDSPGHEQAFNEAWSRHHKQMRLEAKAWKIHRAIMTGQDVFLCGRIERREIPNDGKSEVSQKLLHELEEIYGAEYIQSHGAGVLAIKIPELRVEVAEVLYGDLEPGSTVTFSGRQWRDARLVESETVLVHFDDSRMLYSHSEGGELYETVPREALDWYQSLTSEDVEEFEARCVAGRAE